MESENENTRGEKALVSKHQPASSLVSSVLFRFLLLAARMFSANATAAAAATAIATAAEASHSSESQKLSTKATPLDLAASALELAAANAATLRRRLLGVAAAELRALPSGRVSGR